MYFKIFQRSHRQFVQQSWVLRLLVQLLKASLDTIHPTAGEIIDAIQPPQRKQEQELSQAPQKGCQRKSKKAKRK